MLNILLIASNNNPKNPNGIKMYLYRNQYVRGYRSYKDVPYVRGYRSYKDVPNPYTQKCT